MVPFTILLVIIMLGFLFLKKKNNEKRMIENVTEVKIINKKIVNDSDKLKLVPSAMSSNLSNAGTKITEDFFVTNNPKEKKKIVYRLTIEATLENNRKIQEDINVSKQLYSKVSVNHCYPLMMFK